MRLESPKERAVDFFNYIRPTIDRRVRKLTREFGKAAKLRLTVYKNDEDFEFFRHRRIGMGYLEHRIAMGLLKEHLKGVVDVELIEIDKDAYLNWLVTTNRSDGADSRAMFISF